MGVQNDSSMSSAVAKMLTPLADESVEPEVTPELEQESPEQETEQAVGEEVEAHDDVDGDDDTVEVEEDAGEGEVAEADIEETEELDDPLYTLKVSGEVYEVNLEELKKGYRLDKANTQKSQQLAAERDEVKNLKTQLDAERTRYLQANAQLAQVSMGELSKAKTELDAIDKNDDPIGYVQKQLEMQDIEKNIQSSKANYEHAQTQNQQETAVRLQQYVVEQNAVLSEQLAGWNDETEGAAIKQGIKTFALNHGYSEADLNNVSSARDIIVLNKARLYDELMESKAKLREKRSAAKPTLRVKPSQPKSDSTKKARIHKDKRAKLKSSGSIKDAQSIMLDMLQRKSATR